MSIGRLRETSQHLAVEGIVLFPPHNTRPFLRLRVAAGARGRDAARAQVVIKGRSLATAKCWRER